MKHYNPMMIQSPSQTVGPYFAQGLLRDGDQVFTNTFISENACKDSVMVASCATAGKDANQKYKIHVTTTIRCIPGPL